MDSNGHFLFLPADRGESRAFFRTRRTGSGLCAPDRRQRCGCRSLRKSGSVGVGTQKRYRNGRADPRPLAGPDGVRRPEPGLGLDLRLLRGGPAPDRRGRLAYRAPYSRRRGRRPA
ncbi:microcin-processing peptidase 1 domain protein [Bordetella holmesii 70147]|nr:microcin-processing peptidase 1 domain protein [Bordetella holmesii 70147]